MTDQNAQRPRFAPGAVSRGGAEKTVSGADVAPLLVDLDSQPSAESWAPVLVDTPGFGGSLFPVPEEPLPSLPLPGPVYPDPDSH